MTRELALGMMVALGILALAGMAWSIVRRRRAGDQALSLPGAAGVVGKIVAEFSVLHVATTEANNPLQRIWAKPLAYRSKTLLQVKADGIVLMLRGEGEVGILRSAISDVSRATWTIDKAVDPDGLVVVSWHHDGQHLDTYLRSVDQPADTVIDAIIAITRQQEDNN